MTDDVTVPPEIVERAAHLSWQSSASKYDAPFAWADLPPSVRAMLCERMANDLAAVYGDIVEAATTAAYDVCARQLASQRDAYEADYDRAVEAARRDALAEAIDVVEETLTYGARHHTVNALIDLRDATAPPHAPTATVETR